MHIPTSSLHDQHIQKKNKFRFGFVFLLIVSVGLNIFLLFSDQQNNAVVTSLPQDAGTVPQISVKPSEVLAVPQPAAVIKPVSFTVPSALEGKAIRSLKIKIRNSLNFTVCRMITRENGCAALSAHLGRLMVWFMDINKGMRNGPQNRDGAHSPKTTLCLLARVIARGLPGYSP